MIFYLDLFNISINVPVEIATYDFKAFTAITIQDIRTFMITKNKCLVFKQLDKFMCRHGPIMRAWLFHLATHQYGFQNAERFFVNKEEISNDLVAQYATALEQKNVDQVLQQMHHELAEVDRLDFEVGDSLYYMTTISAPNIPPLTFYMEVGIRSE